MAFGFSEEGGVQVIALDEAKCHPLQVTWLWNWMVCFAHVAGNVRSVRNKYLFCVDYAIENDIDFFV